jgi:hypothetical protein
MRLIWDEMVASLAIPQARRPRADPPQGRSPEESRRPAGCVAVQFCATVPSSLVLTNVDWVYGYYNHNDFPLTLFRQIYLHKHIKQITFHSLQIDEKIMLMRRVGFPYDTIMIFHCRPLADPSRPVSLRQQTFFSGGADRAMSLSIQWKGLKMPALSPETVGSRSENL